MEVKLNADHAVVVGATGRVGFALCHRLREAGVSVTGVARFSDGSKRAALEAAGVRALAFDVVRDDTASLPAADLVFFEIWDPSQHGGAGSREAIWELNYHAVGRIAQRYASEADLINGCSGNVYGTSSSAWKETDAPRPNDEYGLARFAQERLLDFLCAQFGGRVVHLRYYHANDATGGLIRRMAEAIRAGQSLGGSPDQRLSVIGLSDFVRCTVLAGARRGELPSIVNVCHPRVWTRRELAERIRRGLGEGEVLFDEASGGQETSVLGDPSRMLEHFGEPREPIEPLIDAICEAVKGGV